MAIDKAAKLIACGLLVVLGSPSSRAQNISNLASGGAGDAVRKAAAQPPAPPAENPPAAPKVTCDGDQLKISANNATLGSVLAAVHTCIGVQIDIPAGTGGGRTFEELGPGPERQVLEALLSGTDLNYVIGSSDANPGKVETVLLMERTNSKEQGVDASTQDRPLTPGRRTWMEAVKNAKRSATSSDEISQPAEESSDSTAVDDTAAAPPAPPVDNANANATQPAAGDIPPATPDAAPASVASPLGALSPAGPLGSELPPSVGLATDSKSTDERITDMQQMFQQRRQLSQGQAPATTQSQP